MMFDTDEVAHLHLCADGAGTQLSAIGPCELSVGWPSTARPDEIDRELLRLIECLSGAPVMVYDARMPARLLSRSGISEAASGLRTRLRDVMAGALLVRPTLHDLSLPAVARALGVGDEEASGSIIDDPARGAALCREVTRAVRQELSAMPPAALALVRELLLTDGDLAWLGPDELEVPPIEAGALEMLIAGRPTTPGTRRRERAPMQTPLPMLSTALLDDEGPVAEALDEYARRDGQVEMAGAVGEVMEDGGILMVEAGTGVGKTLAYLIPAILWARANAAQVVISTNTKNLQEQLIDKDLPMLHERLEVDFASALVKGRANYVCVRRYVRQIRDALGSMMGEDRRAAAYLVSWFAQSESCDLGQIPAEATQTFDGLKRLIDRVRSDRASCLGPSCEYAERCPLRVARARARNADIIVSNHALTLADTQFDVLPKTSRVIFDEAHNLESVATDQLGYEVSNFSFRELARTFGGDDRRRGIRDSIVAYLNSSHPQQADVVSKAHNRLSAAAEELEPVGDELGQAVIDACVALDDESGAGRARIRLRPTVYETGHWQRVGEAAERVRTLLEIIDDALGQIAEKLGEGTERGSPQSDLAMEAAGARVAAAELNTALGTVLDDDPGVGHVMWAEMVRRRWGDLWRLAAAPIDVGPALQRAVYDKRDCVVMTSGTLTVDGQFDYMRQRLGLDDPEAPVRELIVPSPFHYREQLLMCVPTDMPTRGEDGREEALAEGLLDIAEVAGGGVLLLFTSRKQMDRVFERIQPRLADEGLSPICQYTSGPRSWLLQQLRERGNTVLFGLKSFWEGIDVPGPALRCVVITKLPFAVPTDPIVESRCELAAERGRDGGSDYYIPETILGFKQGFGRLIRSVTDQGVVFVLDNRIITRSYGRRFFESIPDCRFEVAQFHECLREAERWLR